MTRYYDWNQVFSRQTGTHAETVIVLGARSIGKTFGLRLELVKRCIKSGNTFVNMSRTRDESKAIARGYFDKLQAEGFFSDCQFKVEGNVAYHAPAGIEHPEWTALCYYTSLTTFQRDKQTTFANVRDVIFDEAVIDRRDRYHRYLPYEYSVFLDACYTVFREVPGDGIQRHVYILGNSCDLTCPYLAENGIRKPPGFGFHWYRDKSVLLHYVEPWDAEDRKANTLVGRMMAGDDAAKVAFDNIFDLGDVADIKPKSPNARFEWGMVFQKLKFGIWLDYKTGIAYMTDWIPKDAKPIYSLTKSDGTVNYTLVRKADGIMQSLLGMFYAGLLRYPDPATKEAFLEVLDFLGVR